MILGIYIRTVLEAFHYFLILVIGNLPKESHGEIQIVETDLSMWKFKNWNRFSGCDSWAKFLMASILLIWVSLL